MEQRVSAITLGVADVRRARDFYRALGWEDDGARVGGTGGELGWVVFQLAGGVVLVLEEGDGGSGVALTYLVEEAIDVEVVMAEARGAGGTVVLAAGGTDEGGYRGAFADPDGHIWHVRERFDLT